MTELPFPIHQEGSPLLVLGDQGVNLTHDVITTAPVSGPGGVFQDSTSRVSLMTGGGVERDAVPFSTSSAGGEVPSET